MRAIQTSCMALVRDEVFRHFREHTSDIRFGDYMKDARLVIEKPALLVKAIQMINDLPLESGDNKGDLYEYLLSKLTTAGINGQFRTPRHIIKLMVRMLDPKPDETVADPACGTAGFLVSCYGAPAGNIQLRRRAIIREEITGPDGKPPKVDYLHRRPARSGPSGTTSKPRCSMASTSTTPCCASPP